MRQAYRVQYPLVSPLLDPHSGSMTVSSSLASALPAIMSAIKPVVEAFSGVVEQIAKMLGGAANSATAPAALGDATDGGSLVAGHGNGDMPAGALQALSGGLGIGDGEHARSLAPYGAHETHASSQHRTSLALIYA